VEETIIELRGNGVVMTIYEIDKETLDFLRGRASRMGEDLSQLWFDPFFWHSPKMHQIKLGLKSVREYRGLMNDDISFMEIRRKEKKRKKYLVKELLGEGQLFPMVNFQPFKSYETNENSAVCTEMRFGAGCIATYVSTVRKGLYLSELQFLLFSSKTDEAMLFSPSINLFQLLRDDFLIRSQDLMIT
jgi:hypothetical protein